MDTVFPIVIKGIPFVAGYQEDPLRRLADAENGQRFQWKGKGFLQCFGLEIQDENAAKAHFRGLEEDALPGNAQVHVHHAVLRLNGAGDDIG